MTKTVRSQSVGMNGGHAIWETRRRYGTQARNRTLQTISPTLCPAHLVWWTSTSRAVIVTPAGSCVACPLSATKPTCMCLAYLLLWPRCSPRRILATANTPLREQIRVCGEMPWQGREAKRDVSMPWTSLEGELSCEYCLLATGAGIHTREARRRMGSCDGPGLGLAIVPSHRFLSWKKQQPSIS